MTIDVYLDTNDEIVASAVFEAVDELARLVGTQDIAPGEFRRGSIFRRTKATIRGDLTEQALQHRLKTLERSFKSQQVDSRQADMGQEIYNAVSLLIKNLENVPRACIRIGSLLIAKYREGSEDILLIRELSQPEIMALEKYPELQAYPETVFSHIGLVISGQIDSVGYVMNNRGAVNPTYPINQK
jgi:hypothetical protein